MKRKILSIGSLVANFTIFVMVLISWIVLIFVKTDPTYTGWAAYKFFTVDSNLLMGIIALISIFVSIYCYVRKKTLPMWLHTLELVGTTCVFITFLTVIFYLYPTSGMTEEFTKIYFGDEQLLLHVLVPIISVINFVVLESEQPSRLSSVFFTLIPMLFYSVYYLLMVVFKVGYYDWYGFASGGVWPYGVISLVLFHIIALVLGFLLFLAHKLVHYAFFRKEDEEDEGEEVEVDVPAEETKEEEIEETEEEVISDEVVTSTEENVQESEEEGVVTEQYTTETGTIHAVKKRVKKKKPSDKPDNKYKDGARVYHISQHILGGWQVKLAKGEKAIKVLPRQKDAIEYAKQLVKTQGGSIRVHSMKGSIRKAS